MKKPKPLDYHLLRKKLTISQLGFKSTDEIKTLTEFVGQERALEALNFGIGIKSQGYNLYAMGPSGIGKRSLVNAVLAEFASKRPVPPDWCYIHNFKTPEDPIAIKLPAGTGSVLQQDMKVLMEEIGANIISVLESDHYQAEMTKLSEYYARKRKRLPKKVSYKIDSTSYLYKEQHEKEKALQAVLLTAVLEPLINKLKKKYAKFPQVVSFLRAVQFDIIEHVNDFIKQDEKTNLLALSLEENPSLTKYKINLLVNNANLKGAPIIFEESPSYSSIICRVEYTAHLGVLTTNFSLIRPGSLHLANGGYLIIEARKLKKNREAWEALKSALYAREVKIKPIEQVNDAVKPISLTPVPIPLDVKVILLGDRNTYYTWSQNDPDFPELFKVAVDFDEQINRNKTNVQLYARLIGTVVQRDKLRAFTASAVAVVIDHSSRLAEDIEKLSTHIRNIEDLIIEANYWAGIAHKKMVEAEDVKKALEAQIHRMDRARELYYEDINRDFIIINTEGTSIGQVNCLSVRRVGNFSYGHPTRVTARVRVGKGKLIDIQREIKMAGPMHSKAGLIIANFLASKFNQDHTFALSASLAFEQVYCWTDGDSASVGELCALLSALADVPIFQFLAVTGSSDQYGEVQAIGGVNEKIEGFFDVCKAKGLTGKQGVIIPAVNQKNLMLRDDIVQAAKQKQFAIYTIETIDQAVALLTGVETGERNKQGQFASHTLYHKIEKRLQLFIKNRIK